MIDWFWLSLIIWFLVESLILVLLCFVQWLNLLKFDYFNIEYTENNTYIYNRPSRSLTESDRISTHHQPQNGSRGRRTRRKHAWKLAQIGQSAEIGIIYSSRRPSQAHNRRKAHEISPWSAHDQPLTSQIKMWKNCITSHFLKSLLFSLKYSRP